MRQFSSHARPYLPVLVASCLVAACEPASGDATVETDDQKVSYAIGANVGTSLTDMADRIDVDAVHRGLVDGLSGDSLVLSEEEMHGLLQGFAGEMQQAAAEAAAESADANLAAAREFMETNASREGVITAESGLQYEVLEASDGASPGPEDRVVVHYRGTLLDGTQFDSSYDRGGPATFGLDGVIAGFSEGLKLMTVGSKYKLYIPPELGYGTQDRGAIPPNSALIFELELLDIE